MRSFSAFLLALLLGTAALAQDNAGTAPGTMAASVVEGTVTLQRSNGPAQPLAQGTVLYEGDVVQTGVDSRLEISMANGSTLRLGEKARLDLRNAQSTGKAFSARLWLGSVWARVHKLLPDESFQVETENAVAGVRGTEFLVEADAQGREGRVRVYEGMVEVRDHAGQWMHRVEPGRELAIRSRLRPAGPTAFDPGSDRSHSLMRWVRERPVRAPGLQREPERSEPGKSKPQDRGEKGTRQRKERRHRLFQRFRLQ